jgi:hypothetical protein
MFVSFGDVKKFLDGVQKLGWMGLEGTHMEEYAELGETDLGSPTELAVDCCLVE